LVFFILLWKGLFFVNFRLLSGHNLLLTEALSGRTSLYTRGIHLVVQENSQGPEVLDGKHKDNYDWPFLFQAAQHHLSLGPVYFLGSAQHDQQLLTVETRTVLAGQITRKNRKVGMKVAGLEL